MRLPRDNSDLNPRNSPRNQWWMGILTIAFYSGCGLGLSLLIEWGKSFRYESSPEILNLFFLYLGIAGRFAQYLYTGNGDVLTKAAYYPGERVCIVINAIVYAVLLLIWFLWPKDNRQQQVGRGLR